MKNEIEPITLSWINPLVIGFSDESRCTLPFVYVLLEIKQTTNIVGY